ncbi:MAG: class B sortase, partial [Clostridia bacterium]|nr:class B sortase [Clostridia bacterium]
VKGWVTVPDSNIDYPVVQSADNFFYLRRNWLKESDRHGVPFLDSRCSIDPFTQNTIIYGHNMKDSLMFHDLVKYEKLSFYKEAPVITFNTIDGNYHWKVFAAFIANTEKSSGPVFDYLVPGFDSDTDFLNFIAQVRERSIIDTSVDVKSSDKILTLSTCEYQFPDARIVVMARLVRTGESESVGSATLNPSPLMPDIWYKLFGGVKPVFDTSSAVSSAAGSSSQASKASSPSKSSSSSKVKSSSAKSTSSGAGSSSAH